MTDKKQRSPKKLSPDQVMKQFDLQALPDKLLIAEHCRQGIEAEKKKLEEQLKMIG